MHVVSCPMVHLFMNLRILKSKRSIVERLKDCLCCKILRNSYFVKFNNSSMNFDRFVDDRLLTSRDALNKAQLKIKLVDIDENARDYSQRFGRRVLVRKILVTIRYIDTEEIEEVELDIEELEARIKKERLFSSSNRWVSPTEIKNGYIVASRHLDLISDAIALDIISF
jgi:hypothetical protein